jgi:hypothetical protein
VCLRLGWQWPTLPHRYQCSTIGACGLNCRVRDGAGCTPTALTTNQFALTHRFVRVLRFLLSLGFLAPRNNDVFLNTTNDFGSYSAASAQKYPHLRIISCQKPSTISTGSLHTLLRFHVLPIKLVVYQRSYFLKGMGYLVLRWASHLDAFSGYPIRRSLLSSAPGGTTDTQALRPSRSSRTRDSSSQIPNAHSG